jgi:ABC-2 type transport system permease protein
VFIGLLNIVLALTYRELVWFRRFLADYVVSWVFTAFISLSIILIPMSISDVGVVISRFSSLVGVELDLGTALLVSVLLSSIVPVVAVCVNDVAHTIFAEFKFIDVGPLILESTTLKYYLLANAFVRSSLMTLGITAYLLPVLTYVLSSYGILVFLIVELSLQISAMILGLYTTLVASLITFYTNVSRPWVIANLLPPLILSGSGIYIPTYVVPLILRVFAYVTPVPYVSKVLQVVATCLSLPEVLTFLTIATILLTSYLLITTVFSTRLEFRVRR